MLLGVQVGGVEKFRMYENFVAKLKIPIRPKDGSQLSRVERFSKKEKLVDPLIEHSSRFWLFFNRYKSIM